MTDEYGELEKIVYPGSGMIMGMTSEENVFVGYFLTASNPVERNRKLVFYEKSLTLRLEIADQTNINSGSAALLQYPVLIALPQKLVIMGGNGTHTNVIYSHFIYSSQEFPVYVLTSSFEKNLFIHDPQYDGFRSVMHGDTQDPDFIPKISAATITNQGALGFQAQWRGLEHFSHQLKPGIGYSLCAYACKKEKPLSYFIGKLMEVSISSLTAEQLTEKLYLALGPQGEDKEDLRVSVGVMMYDLKRTKSTLNFYLWCEKSLRVASRNRDDLGVVVWR